MKKIEFDINKSIHILEQSQLNMIKNIEIIRCITCNEIPIIDIIGNNNNILLFCINHQEKSDYSTFLSKCSIKCPNCFESQNITKINDLNICNRCKNSFKVNDKINIFHKCLFNNNINELYCLACRKYLCNNCKHKHNNSHSLILLSKLFLKNDEERFIKTNIELKEAILNNLFNYINNIQNDNKYKEKTNQLLVLLEEKKKKY